MKRPSLKMFIVFFLAVSTLLLAHSLFRGDPDNSIDSSQDLTTVTPTPEQGKHGLILTRNHIFSDRIQPSPMKDSAFTPRSINTPSLTITTKNLPGILHQSQIGKSSFKILDWAPDPKKHHVIAELMVRKDIDYKILNMIGTGR